MLHGIKACIYNRFMMSLRCVTKTLNKIICTNSWKFFTKIMLEGHYTKLKEVAPTEKDSPIKHGIIILHS